jgi:molybdenum-dependent DNA-binding transcriptional regulator ModE
MSAIVHPRRQALLLKLASGSTLTDAAKAVGVSLKSASRWSRSPEFQAELRARLMEQAQHAMAELASHTTKAVRVVAEVLDNPSAKLRLTAATTILDRVLKLLELDLEKTVAKAEDVYEQLKAKLGGSDHA